MHPLSVNTGVPLKDYEENHGRGFCKIIKVNGGLRAASYTAINLCFSDTTRFNHAKVLPLVPATTGRPELARCDLNSDNKTNSSKLLFSRVTN